MSVYVEPGHLNRITSSGGTDGHIQMTWCHAVTMLLLGHCCVQEQGKYRRRVCGWFCCFSSYSPEILESLCERQTRHNSFLVSKGQMVHVVKYVCKHAEALQNNTWHHLILRANRKNLCQDLSRCCLFGECALCMFVRPYACVGLNPYQWI